MMNNYIKLKGRKEELNRFDKSITKHRKNNTTYYSLDNSEEISFRVDYPTSINSDEITYNAVPEDTNKNLKNEILSISKLYDLDIVYEWDDDELLDSGKINITSYKGNDVSDYRKYNQKHHIINYERICSTCKTPLHGDEDTCINCGKNYSNKVIVILNEQFDLMVEQVELLNESYLDWEIKPIPKEGLSLSQQDELMNSLSGIVVFATPIPYMIKKLSLRMNTSRDIDVKLFHNDKRDKVTLPNDKVIFKIAETGWQLV